MHPTDLQARGCEGCSKLHSTGGATSTGQPKCILSSARTRQHRQLSKAAKPPAPLCSQSQACPFPCYVLQGNTPFLLLFQECFAYASLPGSGC